MKRIRKSIGRNEDGTVAIEFAVLALPFFLVFFAIMEIALVLLAAMQVEHAVDLVSRRLTTGELSKNQATVRERVCEELVIGIACENLRIDYREIATLGEFSLPAPVKDRAVDTGAFAFTTVENPSFATLRVGYEWPLILKPLASLLAGLDGGKVFVMGTAMTRIEK